MKYTGKELTALLKMGVAMAAADGKLAEEERVVLVGDLLTFGVTTEDAQLLLKNSQDMTPAEAIIVLSNMNNEQKKYATAYLAVIMASDGEIADSEITLWKMVSTLCNFPTMTVFEALDFWANN